MSHGLPVYGHIAIGSLAILFFWAAFLSTKGGTRHRAWGRRFFVTLMAVALSVAPLILLRPGPFDPGWVIQFTYLALCLMTVTMVGWTAIRLKDDLDRFRGRPFRSLGIVIFLLGCVVLAAGIARQNVLTVSFSWVGLVYGGAMIRFAWMKAEPHPRWSLIWHLNAVCGLFNAVHGTFLAVTWRMTLDPTAGDELGATMQALTVLVGLGLRIWFGARYGAPIRLTIPRSAAVQTA